MEKLDSVIATLALKLKGIVIIMMSARIALVVDQTTVQHHLVLPLKLIAVINQLLEMKIFVHLESLVEKIKGTVMLIMSVKMVLFVDQTIVQTLLDFILNLIVVMSQLLEMNIFVHLEFLVEKMKEIVIQTLNVKATTFVDQTTVQFYLVLTLILIAVVVLKS